MGPFRLVRFLVTDKWTPSLWTGLEPNVAPLGGAMFTSLESPSGLVNYAYEELQTARRLLLIASSSKSRESKDNSQNG